MQTDSKNTWEQVASAQEKTFVRWTCRVQRKAHAVQEGTSHEWSRRIKGQNGLRQARSRMESEGRSEHERNKARQIKRISNKR